MNKQETMDLPFEPVDDPIKDLLEAEKRLFEMMKTAEPYKKDKK